MNVLVAEDDATSALLLKRVLGKNGHTVVVAEDGLSAMEVLERQPFDVLITDWMMPRMDGLELVQRVRKRFDRAPVMMVVTAYATEEARIRALEAGADHYLPKPCRPRDLLEQLGLQLRLREPSPGQRVESSPIPPEPLEEPRTDPGPLAQSERDALFQEFQPLVRRLIGRYGSDPEARQDLEGELYCMFAGFLNAYDPSRGIPIRPYLVRNLSAAAYTLVRSQWRRQRREISLDMELPLRAPLQVRDPSAQWDSDMLSRQLVQALPALIEQLPPRQRRVLIARYYESRSFEEIARELQVRPATVRSLLRHGLNAIRAMLGRTGLI